MTPKHNAHKVVIGIVVVLLTTLIGTCIGYGIVMLSPKAEALLTRQEEPVEEVGPYQVAENGYSGNPSQALLAPIITDPALEQAAEEAKQSVVTVVTHVVTPSMFGLQEGAGIGSGVVFSRDEEKAYIITNQHVIADSSEIFLYFDEDTIIPAGLQGEDVDEDLAVLKVEKKDMDEAVYETLKPIQWADSDSVRVGDTCLTVGCFYDVGYMDSVAAGIVSGTEREISYDGHTVTVMQTDAAINPGNSGGATVNTEGKLIGISSAKIQMDSVEGMCFFIPSNTVRPTVEALIQEGSIDHPSLGIASYGIVSESMAEIYHVPVGLIVYTIERGSAGQFAGLESGDIITAINGQAIRELSDVDEILDRHLIGDTVELTVVRTAASPEPFTLRLTLVSSTTPETGHGSFFNGQ